MLCSIRSSQALCDLRLFSSSSPTTEAGAALCALGAEPSAFMLGRDIRDERLFFSFPEANICLSMG